MQYLQMDKSDRDPVHARLADAECKDVLEKWPNSQFATDAANMERQIQEVLAEGEMKVGLFYTKKGGNGYVASANRLNTMVDQYPLYSQADEALWVAADDYNQMGDRFENKQAEMYTRIVRDYPLSLHAEDAKTQLKAMGRPVPDADPVAEARMKFEIDNRAKRTLGSKITGPFSSRPYTANAAKSGNPTMEAFKPTIPLGVPDTAKGMQTTNEVTIGPVANRDILDKAPDARTDAAAAAGAAPAAAGATDASKPATPDANGTAGTSAPPAATTAHAASSAKAKKAKPPKPPKQVAPKKRAKPSDSKKSTAPPAQTTAPTVNQHPRNK